MSMLGISLLKEIILSFAGESMDEQKKVLDKTFDDWKGEMEQIDDVCVLGLRLLPHDSLSGEFCFFGTIQLLFFHFF